MKDYLKIIIGSLLTSLLGTLIGNIIIINEIKKHSVHPIYGNIKKVDYEYQRTCQPWDSCI